jgi:hypothetical protein
MEITTVKAITKETIPQLTRQTDTTTTDKEDITMVSHIKAITAWIPAWPV